MAFFVKKSQLIIISSHSLIVFMPNVSDISLAIKLRPTIGNKRNYVVKKLEKWEIFNFADFHLEMHIFQFCYSTIETIIYIAIDICTCILVLC